VVARQRYPDLRGKEAVITEMPFASTQSIGASCAKP
jgi:hypothetical protein